MKDLTTIAGRLAEITLIENSFIAALRANEFEICPSSVCQITRDSITLGISATAAEKIKGHKIAFSSSLTLHAAELNSILGVKDNQINFSSSRTFDPSVLESYWRTIHAASILKHWVVASTIVNSHCRMYLDLEKEIFALTALAKTAGSQVKPIVGCQGGYY